MRRRASVATSTWPLSEQAPSGPPRHRPTFMRSLRRSACGRRAMSRGGRWVGCCDPAMRVTPDGHWLAAATMASGFRSLFTRAEAMAILDGSEELRALPYWRSILQYCGWGDLQAVLDEHLYHLANAEGLLGTIDNDGLLRLANAVRSALTLRPSVYTASDPSDPDSPKKKIRFTSRFALRYGTARQADDAARLPEIRGAFNSPFWPWLARHDECWPGRASTSTGGATRSCIGTHRRTPSTSISEKVESTGSAA